MCDRNRPYRHNILVYFVTAVSPGRSLMSTNALYYWSLLPLPQYIWMNVSLSPYTRQRSRESVDQANCVMFCVSKLLTFSFHIIPSHFGGAHGKQYVAIVAKQYKDRYGYSFICSKLWMVWIPKYNYFQVNNYTFQSITSFFSCCYFGVFYGLCISRVCLRLH